MFLTASVLISSGFIYFHWYSKRDNDQSHLKKDNVQFHLKKYNVPLEFPTAQTTIW